MTGRGSSKNIRKLNMRRVEAAREALMRELADLRMLEARSNKTRDEKKEIKLRRKRVEHLRREIQSKSEPHARTGRRR